MNIQEMPRFAALVLLAVTIILSVGTIREKVSASHHLGDAVTVAYATANAPAVAPQEPIFPGQPAQ